MGMTAAWYRAGRRAVALASLVVLLAACGSGGGGSDGSGAGSGNDVGDAVGVDVTWTSDAAVVPAPEWPAAAPADVPPFPGRLDEIMPQRRRIGEDRFGVRMFFSGVSQPQFRAYVVQLRGLGYVLGGVVYYSSEAGRDGAQARADGGDFDAVTAVSATRKINLTVPAGDAGTVTFDIDGLTQAESDAFGGSMPMLPGELGATASPQVGTWPAAWADRVPQPHGCTLGGDAAMGASDTMMNVACAYPDADPQHHQAILASYKAELEAAGFTVTAENDNGGEVAGAPAMLILEKPGLRVTLLAVDARALSITALVVH